MDSRAKNAVYAAIGAGLLIGLVLFSLVDRPGSNESTDGSHPVAQSHTDASAADDAAVDPTVAEPTPTEPISLFDARDARLILEALADGSVRARVVVARRGASLIGFAFFENAFESLTKTSSTIRAHEEVSCLPMFDPGVRTSTAPIELGDWTCPMFEVRRTGLEPVTDLVQDCRTATVAPLNASIQAFLGDCVEALRTPEYWSYVGALGDAVRCMYEEARRVPVGKPSAMRAQYSCTTYECGPEDDPCVSETLFEHVWDGTAWKQTFAREHDGRLQPGQTDP